MPPKKGETECKNKEDFSLLQILGKVFFIQHPARRRASFPKAGAKVRLFSVHANLSRTFRFLEFIFKRIVIQPFTCESLFMKGMGCNESYTLLYYIRGKKEEKREYKKTNSIEINFNKAYNNGV